MLISEPSELEIWHNTLRVSADVKSDPVDQRYALTLSVLILSGRALMKEAGS